MIFSKYIPVAYIGITFEMYSYISLWHKLIRILVYDINELVY